MAVPWPGHRAGAGIGEQQLQPPQGLGSLALHGAHRHPQRRRRVGLGQIQVETPPDADECLLGEFLGQAQSLVIAKASRTSSA